MFKQEREPPDSHSEGTEDDFYDAEILDEMTTNRGELRLRTVSFKEHQVYLVYKFTSYKCAILLPQYSLFIPMLEYGMVYRFIQNKMQVIGINSNI